MIGKFQSVYLDRFLFRAKMFSQRARAARQRFAESLAARGHANQIRNRLFVAPGIDAIRSSAGDTPRASAISWLWFPR